VNADGVAEVDPEKCTSCGACVKACPKKVIRLVLDQKPVDVTCSNKDRGRTVRDTCKVGCIACQACVKNCPSEAIAMDGNLPVIDKEKCTNCGTCIEKCPQKSIDKLVA
jgi:ferredoxin